MQMETLAGREFLQLGKQTPVLTLTSATCQIQTNTSEANPILSLALIHPLSH